MSMYSYCTFMYLHRANWHHSATLNEVFPCFFLSCKAKGKPCNVYCTTATGWLPNCSLTNISHYIINQEWGPGFRHNAVEAVTLLGLLYT